VFDTDDEREGVTFGGLTISDRVSGPTPIGGFRGALRCWARDRCVPHPRGRRGYFGDNKTPKAEGPRT